MTGDPKSRVSYGSPPQLPRRAAEVLETRGPSHSCVHVQADEIPNSSVGGNIGMESAACLANHLHALLQRQSAPETASLAQAFRAYQDQRMEAVHFWNETGHRHMQFITLDTPRHRDMFASRIPPFGFDRTTHISYSRTYLRHVSRGVKLDYVPLATELSGSVPWDGGAAAAGGKGAAAGEALRQSPSKL